MIPLHSPYTTLIRFHLISLSVEHPSPTCVFEVAVGDPEDEKTANLVQCSTTSQSSSLFNNIHLSLCLSLSSNPFLLEGYDVICYAKVISIDSFSESAVHLGPITLKCSDWHFNYQTSHVSFGWWTRRTSRLHEACVHPCSSQIFSTLDSITESTLEKRPYQSVVRMFWNLPWQNGELHVLCLSKWWLKDWIWMWWSWTLNEMRWDEIKWHEMNWIEYWNQVLSSLISAIDTRPWPWYIWHF